MGERERHRPTRRTHPRFYERYGFLHAAQRYATIQTSRKKLEEPRREEEKLCELGFSEVEEGEDEVEEFVWEGGEGGGRSRTGEIG